MKITIIKFKNIIRDMFIFFTFIFFIFIVTLVNKTRNTEEKDNGSIALKWILDYELPIIENHNNKEYKYLGAQILMSQVGLFNEDTVIIEEEENVQWNIEQEEQEQEREIENEIEEEKESIIELEENPTIKTNIEIKEISENNIKPTYTNEIAGVKINNQTSYDILETMNNSSYTLNSKKVIIYHTHTCESYTPTELYKYEMTDSYRTTDLNYTVVRVGDELEEELKKYNFEVIHNNTYHDFPSYNGSYGRSLNTLQNIFQSNNEAQIIIDLHRDAIGSNNNYAPRIQIGDEICAQVMFVVGTDGSGLNHPNWRENLQFAIEVQKKANELYPGLFRPIILRNARYNQHLTTASSIIEVGATGNRLEECLASMKYLAEILNEI